jgi:hypothetical protein
MIEYIHNNMELSLRDMKIFQMKAEIENRKKILCSKRKQLIQSKKENKLLENVFEDYEKYNKHFIIENEKKIKSLQLLHGYIDRITYDLKLTDTKLKESQIDQRDIMKEINILKNEIDDLVEG